MKQLSIQCPLNKLGYGASGYNTCKALIKLGADLRIHPIGKADESLDLSNLTPAINANIKDHKPRWPLIKLWHQHGLFERIGNGKYYGWPIFELDTFTEYELSSLKVPDELIVCSQWAKTIINDHIDKVTHIIPLGVDREIFKPQDKVEDGFYNFFSTGKLEVRKGHDILPRLFSKAFEKKDKVKLRLVVSNPFLSTKEMTHYINQVKATKLGDKVEFLPYLDSSIDMANFINENDCGIYISRAEGWCLGALESMSCKKPVITTNYSAFTEYCTKDNSYLVDITEKESAYDGKWFFNQGNWASIGYDQEEQIIEHMRHCYNNRPDNPNGILTAERFTWNHTATKLLNLIQ